MKFMIAGEGSVEIRCENVPTLPAGAVEITAEQYDGLASGALMVENGEIVECPQQVKTAEQIAAEIELVIDLYVDSVAKAKGYGTATMSPTAACISYAGYENIYQAEAIAFGQWKAAIWPAVNKIYSDVNAGSRSIPTAAEVISELPKMVWP